MIRFEKTNHKPLIFQTNAKKNILLFACYLFYCKLFSQPKVQFDTLSYDFGCVTEGTDIVKQMKFTNIGNASLIINRASTTDPGMVDYSEEAVAPGKCGWITFKYLSSGRVGTFTKGIYISTNEDKWYKSSCMISVKGEIVMRKTEIFTAKTEIDIGDLNFDDFDTVEFTVKNIGKETLYFHFLEKEYSESDLIWLAIETYDSIKKLESVYSPVCDINKSLHIRALFKNVYGNAGEFMHFTTFPI